MGNVTVQEARKAALQRQTDHREQRLARQRRLDTAAVHVAVALAERDTAIAVAELRAGHALQIMTDERLTIREAVDWCGALTLREASRLYRLATTESPTESPTGMVTNKQGPNLRARWPSRERPLTTLELLSVLEGRIERADGSRGAGRS